MSTGYGDDGIVMYPQDANSFAQNFGALGALGAQMTDFMDLNGREKGSGLFAGVPESDIFSGNTDRAATILAYKLNNALEKTPLSPVEQAQAMQMVAHEFIDSGYVTPSGAFASRAPTATKFDKVPLNDPKLIEAIKGAVEREIHHYFREHRKSYGEHIDCPYEHHHVLRLKSDGTDYEIMNAAHENADPVTNGMDYFLPMTQLIPFLNAFRPPVHSQGVLGDLAGSVVSGARGVRNSFERGTDSLLGIPRPSGARSPMTDWVMMHGGSAELSEALRKQFRGSSMTTDGKHAVLVHNGKRVHLKIKNSNSVKIKVGDQKAVATLKNGRLTAKK